MFLADNIIGRILTLQKSETIDDAIGLMVAFIFASGIGILAAVLAIKVVKQITARINECLELTFNPPMAAVPPVIPSAGWRPPSPMVDVPPLAPAAPPAGSTPPQEPGTGC